MTRRREILAERMPALEEELAAIRSRTAPGRQLRGGLTSSRFPRLKPGLGPCGTCPKGRWVGRVFHDAPRRVHTPRRARVVTQGTQSAYVSTQSAMIRGPTRQTPRNSPSLPHDRDHRTPSTTLDQQQV